MNGLHIPQCRYVIRRGERIRFFAVEIPDHTTFPAYKMVMQIRVGIEPSPITENLNLLNQSDFLKQGKGSVNGVQGYIWHTFSNSCADYVGMWVFLGASELSVDIHALRSHLDPGSLTSFLERSQALFKRTAFDAHS